MNDYFKGLNRMSGAQSFSRLGYKGFYILMLLSKGKGAYLQRFFYYHSRGLRARSHEQKGFKEKTKQNPQSPTSLLAILANSHVTKKCSFSFNAKSIGDFRQSLQTKKSNFQVMFE